MFCRIKSEHSFNRVEFASLPKVWSPFKARFDPPGRRCPPYGQRTYTGHTCGRIPCASSLHRARSTAHASALAGPRRARAHPNHLLEPQIKRVRLPSDSVSAVTLRVKRLLLNFTSTPLSFASSNASCATRWALVNASSTSCRSPGAD